MIGAHLKTLLTKIFVFKYTPLFVGRIQFPEGCGTEKPNPLIVVGQQPSSVICHVGLSIRRLSTCQLLPSEQVIEGGRERTPRWTPQDYCNLISEVICHILFVRNGSLDPVNPQREKSLQVLNTRRQDSLKPTQAYLPQAPTQCFLWTTKHISSYIYSDLQQWRNTTHLWNFLYCAKYNPFYNPTLSYHDYRVVKYLNQALKIYQLYYLPFLLRSVLLF